MHKSYVLFITLALSVFAWFSQAEDRSHPCDYLQTGGSAMGLVNRHSFEQLKAYVDEDMPSDATFSDGKQIACIDNGRNGYLNWHSGFCLFFQHSDANAHYTKATITNLTAEMSTCGIDLEGSMPVWLAATSDSDPLAKSKAILTSNYIYHTADGSGYRGYNADKPT